MDAQVERPPISDGVHPDFAAAFETFRKLQRPARRNLLRKAYFGARRKMRKERWAKVMAGEQQ